ncbi:MAG: TonB-dependent receptor [Flavobacteriales bacterium]|nr:MAG: TonB-dependent receptor [Flavobacteriales bacterium]
MTIPGLRTTLSLFLFALAAAAMAQGHRQTVRGTIVDGDTRIPLIGATVVVVGSDPILGATTDLDGRFTINNVPTGRLDLQVRMVGFEEQRMANLLLTSAKELVLEVRMQESVAQLKEFEVKAPERKGELRNDMATLSARRISVEETSRIAGGINDPARMVSAFPGVAGDPSGNNTIVVRGNSPKGVQWRLEGVEIPSPNHFSDDGSTGGPINVLNSDMIDDSEFYTGAFSADYGNVSSAVFDMRLRNGNDREREYTVKVGVLGTDITAEGPLPGLNGGSYLANYRYSTLALLDGAGIVDYGGVPRYTDAAFKVKLPSPRLGTFSVYGIGGRSAIVDEDRGATGDTLFSSADVGSRMGVLGIGHTKTLGDHSFLYTNLSLSGNGSGTDYRESPVPGEGGLALRHEDDLAKWTIRLSSTLNTRINAHHKVRSGIIVSDEWFRMYSNSFDLDRDRMVVNLDRSGSARTVQAFSSWKWRMNEQWSLTSGVHVLYFDLNKATSVEPRIAARYQLRPDKAFTLGAGIHAKTEGLMTYMAQDIDDAGNVVRPNMGLGLTRAAHGVAGYEQQLAEDLQLKAEVYYQYLYDMPVENDPTSAFSANNLMEWFTNKPLVNKGTGYNRGVEVSVEKFFTRGYHYLITASYNESKYKALDGRWHNARFNLGPVGNVLAGKEWKLGSEGKDRTLMAGFRYSVQGGQYYTPIDLAASIAADQQKDGGPAWSAKAAAIHKVDVVASYRIGRAKASHEFKIDVQNVLNSATPVYYTYDRRLKTISSVPQLAILPVMQYTLRF